MSRVPRLLSGNKSKPLPLSQAEAYLLSQIDGLLTDDDLALVAGMTPAQVTLTLNRLVQVGAIAIDGEAPPPAAPPLSRGGPLYDPAELDEAAELEPDKKKRVLELFYRLDDMSYYELLGVPEQAEKKQIKSAYYATAPEFHPDKYFRKNLGSFRQKIEAIFGRITLAHDTLTSQEKRAEYDDYLAQASRNRAASASLEDQTERELAAVKAAVQQAAAAAVAAQPRPAPAPASAQFAARPPASQPQPVPPARAPQPSAPGLSQDEVLRQRKEALARKLMGSRKPGAAPPPAPSAPKGPPPEMDPVIAERAAEALRLRHEAAVAEAKRQQLQRYMENGKAALAKQDYAAAANAFRIASSLEPDDLKIQAICNEGLRVVAAALADGYWKQAMYEEGQERWAEAALSYSRVCAGKPDNALAHERVAYATLKSSTNVRRAVDFARKAVELDAKKPEFRVTLARAYSAAGLDKSVKGELDRALELAPKDQRIQQLVAAARAAANAAANKDGKVS